MRSSRAVFLVALCLCFALPAGAQPAAPAPANPAALPLWDVQVGASFVGTGGNSDTASTGADFTAHRHGAIWQIDSAATAVRTTTDDQTTAERYLVQARVARTLTPTIGLSIGEKLERDRFSGVNVRSILDGSVTWAMVHRPQWTLDGAAGVAWLHESRTSPPDLDDPVGNLQMLSRIRVGRGGTTTQRFTLYPDIKTPSAFRTEFEATAQAAMNAHLGLKLGYLVRYSNDPVPGFRKTDNTMTASVVLRWTASTPAPPR
jgi:putative salt-induced outer membrane protein YdiY